MNRSRSYSMNRSRSYSDEPLDELLEEPFEELFDPPELVVPLLEDTAGPPSSLSAF